ncbi:MAG: class I SAM-dependent methyltransferase [Bacteroidales bacterium]|nr:class I SAM-dependent methyltransferase [Bacteroidales bacterium]
MKQDDNTNKVKHIHPFIDKRVENYCESMHSNDNQQLKDLERQTHLRFVRPNMLSGAWQGEFLMILCKISQPKRILEIGTFSGYSTLCFALATEDDCIIDTIEALQEYEGFLKNNFEKNNVANKIRMHFGQGLDVVNELNEKYDLIFIDAEKVHYPQYYEMCIEKLNKGGLLLADNILWYGKVSLDYIDDKETEAIREFNSMVTKDERVENIIIPIRDGIMVARRL